MANGSGTHQEELDAAGPKIAEPHVLLNPARRNVTVELLKENTRNSSYEKIQTKIH